jgi:hypothetical protein
MSLQRDIDPAYPISGTDITVTMTLASLRRTPTCELVDFVNETGRVNLTLTPLAKHRTARVRYKVPTQRRGLLTLGPAIIELSDPFGLLVRRREIGIPTDVIVHPEWRPIDLPDPQHCQGALIDLIQRLLHQMAVNLEFRSLREYVIGDDLRRINWKASARRDNLTLNEFESRAPLMVHVFLDNDDTVYSRDGFERAVSVAASYVGSAYSLQNETEPSLQLSIPPQFDAVIDSSTRFDAMGCLAQITTDSTSDLPSPSNDPGEFRVNIIICGDRDHHWLDSVDRSMGRGHATVVVYCDTPTGSSFDHDHWFALRCDDFADFPILWGTLAQRTANG